MRDTGVLYEDTKDRFLLEGKIEGEIEGRIKKSVEVIVTLVCEKGLAIDEALEIVRPGEDERDEVLRRVKERMAG